MRHLLLCFISICFATSLFPQTHILPRQELHSAKKNIAYRFKSLLSIHTQLDPFSLPDSTNLITDLHLNSKQLYRLLVDVNFEFHLTLNPQNVFLFSSSKQIDSLEYPTISAWLNLIQTKIAQSH